MHRLIYLKDIPKHELDAIKLFYKRMGRDALWDILEVLEDAEDWLTKEEISRMINCKNIGQDLRFLTFLNIINREYVSQEYDHTYRYALNYDNTGDYRKRYFIPSEYNILACDLTDTEMLYEFLIKFSPPKRRL